MMDLVALPTAVAGLIAVALNAYVLMAGADFGGGVWDFLASGPRRAAQRALIAEAIGPIWEANHVWLILVVVLLFTGFPPAFAEVGTALHIPLTLMLIGIVLRGSAFTFRAHHGADSAMPLYWGRVFAVASAVTPVFLGMCLGAIASGGVPGRSTADFRAEFVAPWLTPFCLGVGVLTLALFAFLAAVYLTVEAQDADLREDFRRRALGAAVAVFVAAGGVLALALPGAPLVGLGLTRSPWALPLHAAAGVAAVTAIRALWTRHYRLARVAAGAQVSLILWGWALSQYPYIVPPTLTISGAAAPALTLTLLLWALAAGALVLFPSLVYLFRVFKERPARGGPPDAGAQEGPARPRQRSSSVDPRLERLNQAHAHDITSDAAMIVGRKERQ
jgi:cytochrome d ubiquinol oxidase subunit II